MAGLFANTMDPLHVQHPRLHSSYLPFPQYTMNDFSPMHPAVHPLTSVRRTSTLKSIARQVSAAWTRFYRAVIDDEPDWYYSGLQVHKRVTYDPPPPYTLMAT